MAPRGISVQVILRRLYVYELYSRADLPVPEIKRLVAQRFNCSTRTVARDLNSMETWLPQIIGIREDAEKTQLQAMEIAAGVKVSLKNLMNLGETARGSPAAQVGAYRSHIEGSFKLAEFMSRTGLMSMEPPSISVKGEMRHDWGLTKALGEYGDIILEAIQTDIEYTNRKQARQDTEQPVVPEEES